MGCGLETIPLNHRLSSCTVVRMTSVPQSSAGGASFRFCGVPCLGHKAGQNFITERICRAF